MKYVSTATQISGKLGDILYGFKQQGCHVSPLELAKWS
jgi:hypothetical protein